MKETCVIWDSTSTYNVLQLDHEPQKVIRNHDEFEATEFSKYEKIFILAELKWDGIDRSNFYGLKLIKKLRTQRKITIPIVVCSFFKSFSKIDFFKTPGHYLLRLPAPALPVEQYIGIDEELLYDINIHIFDPTGFTHTIMHDMENKLDDLSRSISERKELITQTNILLDNKLEAIGHIIIPEKKSEFLHLTEMVKNEINNEINNSTDFSKDSKIRKLIGEKYKPLIYDLLPVPLIDSEQIDYPLQKWEILFIDDMVTTCDEVKRKFKARGINCVTAINSSEAFNLLKEDRETAQKIAMIISDFRLYEGGDDEKSWQPLQGYQILKTIHEKNDSHYAYSILTSKKGTILDKIKHKSSFPVLWFYKADVLSNEAAFNIFYQRICEVGSEVFLNKQNIPNTTIWRYGVKGRVEPGYNYYYKLHLESLEYYECIKDINFQAIEQIRHVKANDCLKEPINYQISLQIGNGNSENRELLQKFRDTILLVRRIYWGLNYFLKKTPDEIFDLLKSDGKFENSEAMKKALYNTTMGISIKDDFTKETTAIKRFGILTEESEFLELYKNEFPIEEDVRFTNSDLLLLYDFFDSLNLEFNDFTEIERIYEKMKNMQTIQMTEFKICLKKIGQNLQHPAFKSRFKEIYSSYEVELGELSDYLKRPLMDLKCW